MLLLLMAFGVAVSRCALGVHFASDVLLGSALGAGLGTLGGAYYLKRLRRVEPASLSVP
jgi:membrane-associated phospholipid phosphatase